MDNTSPTQPNFAAKFPAATTAATTASNSTIAEDSVVSAFGQPAVKTPVSAARPVAPLKPMPGVRPTFASGTSMPPKPARKLRFLPKAWHKVLFVLLLIVITLGVAGGAMAFYTLGVVKDLKAQADHLQTTARGAYDQFKGQNLPGADQGLKDVAKELQDMKVTYNKLAFYKAIPIASAYYNDGLHGFAAGEAGVNAGLKSLEAVTPYADVLGFTGQGTFTGGTTEDRLKLILQTLQKVEPSLDAISKDLETVKSELAKIDEKRYPENFRGKPLRSYIKQAHDVSTGAAAALTEFRPVIQRIPLAAGAQKRQKYLILFQNDNELRPTGGFLTAYSIVYVENGKVTPDKSDDIYQLDVKFKKKTPIPPILGKYLTTEKFFNLRDMNIAPDFKKSMDLFLNNYKLVPGEPQDIDGVVAVDTHILVDLIKVLGPVEVPGYGTFTAENDPTCDCPQIIHALSEIVDRPTPFLRADRKGILGPMMRAILTKAYTAPKQQWPALFETAWKDVQARHAQMYFFDKDTQAAAEKINAAGRMVADDKGGDFFGLVDANLGGAKSNLFIKTDIKQEVSAPKNGEITKKVTLTYKNTHAGSNCNLEAGQLCLNATLFDWQRIYLPKGAKLVSSQGYIGGQAKQVDDEEFTTIEGSFKVEPLGQAKLEVVYTVPYTDTVNYRLKLWKQGGVEAWPVVMDVNGGEEKVELDQDKIFEAKF